MSWKKLWREYLEILLKRKGNKSTSLLKSVSERVMCQVKHLTNTLSLEHISKYHSTFTWGGVEGGEGCFIILCIYFCRKQYLRLKKCSYHGISDNDC